VHAWHALAALAMRGLSLKVADTRVLLFQDTVPGPWQPPPGAPHPCQPDAWHAQQRGEPSAHLLRCQTLMTPQMAMIDLTMLHALHMLAAGAGKQVTRHREGVRLRVRAIALGTTAPRSRSSLKPSSLRACSHTQSRAPRAAGLRGLLPASALDVIDSLGDTRLWSLSVEGVSIQLLTSLPCASRVLRGPLDAALRGNTVDGPMPPYSGEYYVTSQAAETGHVNAVYTNDSNGSRAEAPSTYSAAWRGAQEQLAGDSQQLTQQPEAGAGLDRAGRRTQVGVAIAS
jgi:hypothetical protein